MGRAPSIDDAQPSSSGRTPAMSRAHSLPSSASGPNAAGPSHHEHLVLPHHFTLPGQYHHLHSSPCNVPLQQTPPPPPPLHPFCTHSLHTQAKLLHCSRHESCSSCCTCSVCLLDSMCLPSWWAVTRYGGVLRSWSLAQAVCKCMCCACQGC